MTDDKKPGTSVLASLTADVMGEKQAASKRTLTPVAGEARPVLPTTKASFPNDMPQEVVEQKATELSRIIDQLTEARDAMLTLVEAPKPEAVVDLDAVRKQKEFEADLAAKARAAQDAVYSDSSAAASASGSEVSEETTVESTPDTSNRDSEDWTCPTHKKTGVTKTSEKTGRSYVGCPDCNLFKR